MSETTPPREPSREPLREEEARLPEALAHRPSPRSFQLVWVIPIVALAIGAWIAAKSFWEQGPTITIRFATAEGIEANKTRIRHKAVDIGTVRSVRLSADLKSAIVTAELDRESADAFLGEDTKYWVVRPRIAGGQISGLSTLLAGVYIAADPGASKTERRAFTGVEVPPPVTGDVPGRIFVLRAEDLGSLDINSPLYFRGVLAGRLIATDIAPDGRDLRLRVFVNSPYDKLVTPDTRFWNASGIDAQLDASGVKVHTQSLVTLLLGGIAFETPPESVGAPPAAAESQFVLWPARAQAMRPHETVVETYVLKFEQSVRGLAKGAEVDFRGIAVGEVRDVYLQFDPDKVRFVQVAEIHLYPERLRSRARDAQRAREGPERTHAQRLQQFVERGFRAQLRSGNLLTGQLYVALDFFPKAKPAKMNLAATPPEIPTIATGGLGDLQESITNIVERLEKVPFEQIAGDVRRALASLEATLKKADALVAQLSTDIAPELRATLEQARKTLASAEGALASDSPLQGDLRETLIEVTRAAESVRALTDYLERHPESLLRGKR